MDMKWFDDMEARIPKGKVRTRFAPSPTGYMHIGNLRTALYTWTAPLSCASRTPTRSVWWKAPPRSSTRPSGSAA